MSIPAAPWVTQPLGTAPPWYYGGGSQAQAAPAAAAAPTGNPAAPWAVAGQQQAPSATAATDAFADIVNRGRAKGRAGLDWLKGQAGAFNTLLNTPEAQRTARRGVGIGSTVLGVAPGAMQTFAQQGAVPGIVSAGAGLGAAALTAPISNALMQGSLPMKIAGGALQLFAPALAQSATAGFLGAGEQSKSGAGGTDVSVPATPISPEIPMSDAARERIQKERDLAYEKKSRQELGQIQIDLEQKAIAGQNNAALDLMRRSMPLLERIDRQKLVNTQAIINTQMGAYQQLGRQAGMFKLAGQNIAETGALMRTAISTNPYANAVLQAPSINFG